MIQSEITNLQEVEYSESEAEDEGYKGLPVLDQRQREKLADIQEREIKLALAVQDCGGMESNLYDLIRSVTYEYESEFIEQNALRLAEYRLSDR